MKKRLTALLLVLCLCLCACGKEEVPETTASTVPPTTAAPETTEAPTVATEAPTEPPVEEPVRNPLTGEPVEVPFTGRPVASTMNNMIDAMPQHGNSSTDWLFEVETEGGVTRCMAVYMNPAEVGTIGPVRSARTYFVSLSAGLGAPLAHCGGSYLAADGMHALDQYLEDYRDIDEMSYTSYFFRDSNRLSSGYSYEHTLFTTGEKLTAAMETKGYNDVLDPEGVDYGLQFDEAPMTKGKKGEELKVVFMGGKKTYLHYNSDTGLYEMEQYGSDWIDGNTGEVVTRKNVIVIFAEQSKLSSSLSVYELYGEGDGMFARDGKVVPIRWSRADVHDPYTFTLEEDGTPITLGVGQTYAAVVSPKGALYYE